MLIFLNKFCSVSAVTLISVYNLYKLQTLSIQLYILLHEIIRKQVNKLYKWGHHIITYLPV